MHFLERASVHMNILLSIDTNKLKLTKEQGDIYQKFREFFPKLDVEKVSILLIYIILRYFFRLLKEI